jgi:hypothetical protein|tara:strand:- start:3630 stop:4409 length:780 start_codon:yes stop_codon:yes gene_type:complete
MKLLITTLLTAILSTAAYAETLNIVNPGSEEGMFRQVLTEFSDSIDHQFVQANNPVTAATYLENGNALTMWSSEWPGNKDITSPVVSDDNIVALMTTETIMCSREFTSFNDMVGKQVKIATWGSNPVAKFLNTLGSNLGIDFIVVPYDGSGSTTKGYIANDADTVFTITTRQPAIEQDTSSTCFAFSAAGDLSFRFVDAVVTVDVDESTITALRSVIAEKSKTENWLEKYKGTSTYVGGAMYDESLLDIYQTAVINFTE